MTSPAPQFTVSPPDVPLEGVGVERKHTPGPWVWEYPEEWEDDWYEGDLPSLKSGDQIVMNFGSCEQYYPTHGSWPEPADRQLIAAAPDMLDALIEIVNKYGNGWGGQIAAKAIVKATTPQE